MAGTWHDSGPMLPRVGKALSHVLEYRYKSYHDAVRIAYSLRIVCLDESFVSPPEPISVST